MRWYASISLNHTKITKTNLFENLLKAGRHTQASKGGLLPFRFYFQHNFQAKLWK